MSRREPYQRPQTPPPMRLTDRDKEILEALYAFDGMMSLRQIDRLFFSGQGRTQPRARMRALFANGYVNMPDIDNIHKVPLQEAIFWLDRKGAEIVTSLYGVPMKSFTWRKKPRWSWIAHDLQVNKFRLDVMAACEAQPSLTLHQWVPETEFLADPDKVSYRDRNGKKRERQVRPDSFFTIQRLLRQEFDNPEKFAFLLEIDMATHSNARFIRQKVRAGMAYLKGGIFKKRWGMRYGRWLVVTASEQRLINLKETTEQAGGQGLFYFTTFDLVSAMSVLSEPIWLLAGKEELTSIIPDAKLTTT